MGENKMGKEELGKVAEEELMPNLEKWVNKWERSFEVTLVLGFMVMDRNNFDIVGSRMVIYPKNYENGTIHINALQNYCEGLKENV